MRSESSGGLYEKIREYTEASVSEKRYLHSLRTAETMAALCGNYGLSEEKGMLAGIAHDMCKKCGGDELLFLARKDGKAVSEIEGKEPSLLHGRAAAVLIQEKFGVTDSEIIDGIANHTFGSADSCDFALLLFVADKIEPGRPQSTEEYRKRLFALPCHGIVLAVLEENIRYLESRGKTVARPSLELAERLRAEKHEIGENFR